jgi:hypothetical protein
LLVLGGTGLGDATTLENQPGGRHWYAVFGLWNGTEEAIRYELRWGDRPARELVLEPGARRWHSWRFRTANQDTWPTPVLRYDTDRGPDVRMEMLRLVPLPAARKDYWLGNRYGFMISDDGLRRELWRIFDDPIRRD